VAKLGVVTTSAVLKTRASDVDIHLGLLGIATNVESWETEVHTIRATQTR
jgi:hypothetical protein